MIDSVFKPEVFMKWIAQIEEGTEVNIDEPTVAVENLVSKFKLPQSYKDSILNHFVKEGDNSQYGLANSLSRAAQDFESYDKQIELETIAGEVSMMETPDFRRKVAPRAVA